MSVIRKENWKSDIRLAVTLLVGGEAVHVPSHAFTLRFRVCNGREHYDCWRDENGGYHNCRPNDDGSMLLCFLDNHGLGLGELHCEYYDYAPDADFSDGNKLTVVPQVLPIELVSGAGDDAEQVDAEVIVAIDGLVGDAQEAIAAANEAASRANEAASRAEAATADAVEAATAALRNGEDARQAASAANAAAVRANDAAEAGMALCDSAAASANAAAASANLAADAASASSRYASEQGDYAKEEGDRAARTAQDALGAAERAEAAADAVAPLVARGRLSDAVVTLANYSGGALEIESDGINQPSQGVTLRFVSMNEISAYWQGGNATMGIDAGMVFHVPDGSYLLMTVTPGNVVGLRVSSDLGGEYDILLAAVSRGLIVGGALLSALSDMTHHVLLKKRTVDNVPSLAVGDTLTQDQILLFQDYCNNTMTSLLMIGGSVADVTMVVRGRPRPGFTLTIVYRRDGNWWELVAVNGVVTSHGALPRVSELSDEDFDEICV